MHAVTLQPEQSIRPEGRVASLPASGGIGFEEEQRIRQDWLSAFNQTGIHPVWADEVSALGQEDTSPKPLTRWQQLRQGLGRVAAHVSRVFGGDRRAAQLELPQGPTNEDRVEDIGSPLINQLEFQSLPEDAHAGRGALIRKIGMTGLKAAVLAVGVGPLSEGFRYGAFTTTFAATKDPFLAAGVLAGTTTLIEGATVLAGAKWIADDKIGDVINRIDERVQSSRVLSRYPRLQRFLSPRHKLEEKKLSLPVKMTVALYAGSLTLLEAMQRENPSRTANQNLRDGMVTAGLLSLPLFAEGLAVTEGLVHYDNPLTWIAGGGLLAVAGVHAAIGKVRTARKAQRENAVGARYDLTKEELTELEGRLVASIENVHPEPGIYAALLRPEHEFANVARHYEANYFPEVKELSNEVEESTLFVTLVDTRRDARRVVHAMTITGLDQSAPGKPSVAVHHPDRTGFATIDDLIEMGNFTAQDFRDYYTNQGIDLSQCIAVETNFRVGDRVPKFNEVDTAYLAYQKVFDLFLKNNPTLGKAVVFANINRASRLSFRFNRINHSPLMDRSDLKTSESLRGLKFTPVSIMYDESAQRNFGTGTHIPEVVF